MIGQVLLAVALISTSVRELEAASFCGPDCRDSVSGGLVAVPWDCTQYAVCGYLHNNDELYPSEPESCADGFYFNPNDPLGPSCNAIALADPGYCITTCNPCEPLWSYSGDTTPNPDDCSQFYVCLASGVLYSATCTDLDGGLYYNYFRGGCQNNEDYCFPQCDTCVPYCIEEYRGTNIPDPADCTSYYTCDPPTITHFQCPSTEIFNRETGQCDLTAPCIEECITR